MKTCTKCKIEKPFEAFHRCKTRYDGYQPYCIECIKLRKLEIKDNPIMQLEKQIRSSIILENKLLKRENKKLCKICKNIFLIDDLTGGVTCKECGIRYRKEYYENNKEKIREKQIEYREENREKSNKQKREHYENNKEKIREKNREHYENNKEKIKERNKKYYEKNKENINEKRREYQREYAIDYYKKNKDKIKEYEDKNKDKLKERQRRYRLKKKLEKELKS